MNSKDKIRLFMINKRKELGLSLTDFGNMLGVSRQLIWGIEHGKWSPTLDILDKLEELFGTIDRTKKEGN